MSIRASLYWTTPAERPHFLAGGYVEKSYAELVLRIEQLKSDGAGGDLRPPIPDDFLHRQTFVSGVVCKNLGDARRLFGWIIEPAFRQGFDLALELPVGRASFDKATSIDDPDFGYPWTHTRASWLLDVYERKITTPGLPPMTPIEDLLHVAMRRSDLLPDLQYGVGPYRVDFAFPALGIAVEADGRLWHDAVRDQHRDVDLAGRGWRVLRFTGSRIWADADGCADEIRRIVAVSAPSLATTPVPAQPVVVPRGFWRRILDRLTGRARRVTGESVDPGAVPVDPTTHLCATHEGLDADQRRAVASHDGVVQVLAPAGSGKTTTLVARARELAARGIPQERILLTTFNKKIREELTLRLPAAGVGAVEVHTFNSLGHLILREERQLRGDIGEPTLNQWRRLANIVAKEQGGVWIEPEDAKDWIARLKLADMVTPAQALARAEAGTNNAVERSAAKLYAIYEEEQQRVGRNDFADQILLPLLLFRADPALRQRWERRWWAVMVDEFQDVERAQELLVTALAAPEDCLTVVGDEDQCIYAWRRADVRRVLDLELSYPGLSRVTLRTNYRSRAAIVVGAKHCIEKNTERFNKPIEACRTEPAVIEVRSQDPPTPLALLVEAARGCPDPKRLAVLARTSEVLRGAALALREAGIAFRAPESVLRPSQAERAVRAYLLCVVDPRNATADDVVTAFRYPNRYLAAQAAPRVLAALQRDRSFGEVFADHSLPVQAFAWTKLTEIAPVLDRMRSATAIDFVHALRGECGLDLHFSTQDRLSRHDMTERDSLDAVTQLAGRAATPTELLRKLGERADGLRAGVPADGIELATIHGAKGREWEHVLVLGVDDDLLPHKRTLDDAGDDREARHKAEEGERRLFYVAVTRARDALTLLHSPGKHSRFLVEAGFTAAPPVVPARPIKSNLARPMLPKPAPATAGRPTPAVESAAGRAFPAKFGGACSTCLTHILPGQRIVSNGKRGYRHENCAPF